MKKSNLFIINLWFIIFLILLPAKTIGQTEVMAWSNMTGIRIDGELIEFESSIRVVDQGWKNIKTTGKELQFRPSYIRDGNRQKVITTIDKIRFEQIVNDLSPGNVSVSLTMQSDTARKSEGVFLCFDLPESKYANGTIRIGKKEINIQELNESVKENNKTNGRQIEINGDGRTLKLDFTSSVTGFIRKEKGNAATLYIQLARSNVKKRQSSQLKFTIHATGDIDHKPVNILVNTKKPGRLFEGFGGNFRLQNPRHDPKVIDYCLDNMRIAWGRVEMPWRSWHSKEEIDPIKEARAGRLNERVEASMKMAQRLAAIGMPVIVSAWFPPEWAIDGDPASYVRHGGVQAFRLDPLKQKKIYKSLTDYLVYLKEEFGVEAVMYSFNESDLGIDVLHTAEEHAEFIKGLGEYMASRGLSTKMVLGDNSDATTFDFIKPAMYDKETHKYIGAVSFHSWRGCDDETLQKWANAAKELNVPLIIGEGSTDAAAHNYPQIFAESTFALYEINLYTRICAICQPLSILQWQLTSDYSIIWGDGIFGSSGDLRPTQRFWNLKQLASTPEQAFSLPFTCDHKEVNCAAFGNISRDEYAVHIVNNGASREGIISGLPENLNKIKAYATNSSLGMEEISDFEIKNNQIHIQLPPVSFVSIFIE